MFRNCAISAQQGRGCKHTHSADVCSAYSGLCELTNQSRPGLFGGEGLKETGTNTNAFRQKVNKGAAAVNSEKMYMFFEHYSIIDTQ